jgi:hypothetical protein
MREQRSPFGRAQAVRGGFCRSRLGKLRRAEGEFGRAERLARILRLILAKELATHDEGL